MQLPVGVWARARPYVVGERFESKASVLDGAITRTHGKCPLTALHMHSKLSPLYSTR